jgi:hypothetical protein
MTLQKKSKSQKNYDYVQHALRNPFVQGKRQQRAQK